MSGLLPFRTDAKPAADRDPRLVAVDSEEAGAVIDALGSEPARAMLAFLREEPAPPSGIGEALDMSLQHVRYHLDKLEDAGLVEVVDTWYSSRGNEMDVYAPTDSAVVLYSASEDDRRPVREVLSRVLGAVGVLGFASYLVQQIAGVRPAATFESAPEVDANDSGVPTSDAGQATNETTQIATEAGNARGYFSQTGDAVAAGSGIPPGLLFFAGGMAMLLLVVGWWYWKRSQVY